MAAPPPTTYQAKFNQEGDALNGDYQAFLAHYATGAGSLDADGLRSHVLDASNAVPKVFLGLLSTNNTYKVVSVHRPTAYTRHPATASAWDGQVFAFQGDVLPGNFINIVEFPDDAFAPCQVQVILDSTHYLPPRLD